MNEQENVRHEVLAITTQAAIRVLELLGDREHQILHIGTTGDDTYERAATTYTAALDYLADLFKRGEQLPLTTADDGGSIIASGDAQSSSVQAADFEPYKKHKPVVMDVFEREKERSRKRAQDQEEILSCIQERERRQEGGECK
jgi:hypothetical protein